MTTDSDDKKVPVQILMQGDLHRAIKAAAKLSDMNVTQWMISAAWLALPASVGSALELARLDDIKREHQARLDR